MVALLLMVLCWRIKDEEVLMEQEFPDTWPRYARKTSRLIPSVY